MTDNFKKEGFESRNKKIKKVSNRFLYTFMAIFVSGYAFFFSSTLWLPNYYTGVNTTPLGEVVSMNERNIVVDEWTFSKEQRLMEIIVEIEDLSVDGVHDYIYQVKTKEGSFETNVVAADDEVVVIQANRIPKDWTEASLTIDITKENKALSERWTPIVIYTSNKIVENVDSIRKRDLTEYKIAAFSKRIELTEEKIKLTTQEIENISLQISEAESNIQMLQEKIEYQTESEKEETARQIDGFTGQLTLLQSSKIEKEKEIEELKQKIELTNKLLESVRNPEAAATQEASGAPEIETAPQDAADASGEED